MIQPPKHTMVNLRMMLSPVILKILTVSTLATKFPSYLLKLSPQRPQSNRRPVPMATSSRTDQLANQNREWCMLQSPCRPSPAHEPSQRSKFSAGTPPIFAAPLFMSFISLSHCLQALQVWIPCIYGISWLWYSDAIIIKVASYQPTYITGRCIPYKRIVIKPLTLVYKSYLERKNLRTQVGIEPITKNST